MPRIDFVPNLLYNLKKGRNLQIANCGNYRLFERVDKDLIFSRSELLYAHGFQPATRFGSGTVTVTNLTKRLSMRIGGIRDRWTSDFFYIYIDNFQMVS